MIFTFCYQFIIFRFDNYIVHNYSYDEYGSTNELVIGVFFICILAAFVNIIAAMAGKERKRKEHVAMSKPRADKINNPGIYQVAE
jgi:hypothetical protein